MVKSAAETRVATTGRRLTELRERLDRLRAGEVPTRADVDRARTAAREQQAATRRAYSRLLRAHASAVSRALALTNLRAGMARPGGEFREVLAEQNRRLADALVAVGSSPVQARPTWSEERLRLVWRALVDECSSPQWRGWAHALCVVATRLIPSVRGAALTLYDAQRVAYPFAASDDWARDVEQIHQVVGEGPALEVSPARPSMVVDDIVSASRRWPGFVDMAVAAGLQGVTVFLVPLGAPLTGSLTLYQTTPGPPLGLSASDEALLADVAASAVMADGEALTADGEGADLGEYMDVHIATGMLAVRLGISVAEAHLRLRAHAYGSGQTLIETAQAVIGGAPDLA